MVPLCALRRSLGSGRAAVKSTRAKCLGSACLLGLVLSCQPKPTPGPSPAPAEHPRPAPSASAQPATPKGPALKFAAGALRTFRFAHGFVDLADGTELGRADFERTLLRTKDPRAQAAVSAGTLLVLLDDQTPRPLLGPSVALESLVDEDRELAPGWHVLALVLPSGTQLDVEVVRFQVELREPLPVLEPGCALLAPGGTTHASASAALELVGLPLSSAVARFEYAVAEPRSTHVRLPGLESALLSGLPSGDHLLTVRCYDGGGHLLGESQRTVTLNLDEGTASP
jgi:hypothetical protein